METVTDWLELWKELVNLKSKAARESSKCRHKKYWSRKAGQFKNRTEKSCIPPSSSQQFIASVLEDHPGSTLLDIGAGIGDWSAFLASYAKEITALEPSADMGEMLTDLISSAKLENVKWFQGSWPEIDIEPHDYTLASHSMYGEADLKPFIEKMTAITRKGCFLVTRVLYANTIMAKAAKLILGQPFDSPCFQVIFNALLQLGIYPNVLMETGKTWKSWSDDSLEEALQEIKNRLGIQDSSEYDGYLMSLLSKHLSKKNGKYVWPTGNGSALIYWEV